MQDLFLPPSHIVKQKRNAMAIWKRQPQEKRGDYFFSGQFLASRGVVSELTPDEILRIYQDIKSFVKDKDGIDYLQIYTDENGRKLYLIDQLSKDMIESGEYAPLDNHCTLLWAHEY